MAAFARFLRDNEGETEEIQNANLQVVFVELIHETLPWNHLPQTVFGECNNPRNGGKWNEFMADLPPVALMNNGQVMVYHKIVNAIRFAYMPNGGFFPDLQEMILDRVADTVYPSIWDIYLRSAPSSTGSVDRLWYQHLCMLIYVISNGLYCFEHECPDLFGLMGMVLQQLQPDIVMRTFQSHFLSLRAVWDRFASIVLSDNNWYHFDKRFEDYKVNFIENVLTLFLSLHPEWIAGSENRLLCLASSIGTSTLVRKLLARGARATYYVPVYGLTAITAATAAGITDCVKPLVDTCDVNATIIEVLPNNLVTRGILRESRDHPPESQIMTSQFIAFLEYFKYDFQSSNLSNNESYAKSLRINLEYGANVDAPYPPELCGLSDAYSQSDIRLDWHLTCVDMSFYLGHPMFTDMQAHSRAFNDANLLTRQDVCTALISGKAMLDDYLHSRTMYSAMEKQNFLEILLLEQFFVRRRYRAANLDKMGANIARSLLDYGVRIIFFHSVAGSSSLLYSIWARSVDEYGLSADLYAILGWLSQERLPITSDFLESLVEENGVGLLQMVTEHKIICREEISSVGAEALVTAARFENYESVSWLLSMGVDINTGLQINPEKCRHEKKTILAACLNAYTSDDWNFVAMCQHLVNCGAKLRYESSDKTCYRLLENVFSSAFCRVNINETCLLRLVRFFLDQPTELNTITPSEWGDLMYSILFYHFVEGHGWQNTRMQLFEPLVQRWFATGDDSVVLPTAIWAGCSEDMIQTLIDAETDVNQHGILGTPIFAAISVYNFDLAHQLLGLGTNPSDVPRYGRMCAFTKACALRVSSACEKRKKMEFLQVLVQNGAEVNGGYPVSEVSVNPFLRRPLHICAKRGDLDTASFLLQRGADPNLVILEFKSGLKWTPVTALDLAASNGRLDLTQLLLKAGALSVDPGSTGYDGAIREATERSHIAVTELIHQHIALTKVLFTQKPELEIQHLAQINRVMVASKDAFCYLKNVIEAQHEGGLKSEHMTFVTRSF